jgi:alkylation response protein AidB-like acyl-CoA dehydrogenase
MWDAANMSFGLCPMLTQTAAEVISLAGTSEQKELYLERLVKGEWTGTMNLTEPQAGSDLSAVRTQAVAAKEGHYLLTGQKIFITYGDHDLSGNIVHLVLARAPDAPDGVKGISLFIVPKFIPDSDGEPGKRNDIRTISLERKLGIHGSPTAVLSYGDKEGAVGYLLGEENRGLEYMFIMMNMARHAVGIEAYAVAERAYQRALGYAEERIQGRGVGMQSDSRVPIIKHPDVCRMLLEMKCRIDAMRALSLYTAAAEDRAIRQVEEEDRIRNQNLVDVLIPIVKGWSSELGNDVAGQALQVLGGMGFIEEAGAAQHYRDVRITTIYEGTTGIQAADLVRRKLLGDGGRLIRDTIAVIQADVSSVSLTTSREITEICTAMRDALLQLEMATEWILESSTRDPRLPFAASFHYLMLWGAVAGGWQMARVAGAAVRRMEQEPEHQFLHDKVLSACCYVRYVLPTSTACCTAIVSGSELITSYGSRSF